MSFFIYCIIIAFVIIIAAAIVSAIDKSLEEKLINFGKYLSDEYIAQFNRLIKSLEEDEEDKEFDATMNEIKEYIKDTKISNKEIVKAVKKANTKFLEDLVAKIDKVADEAFKLEPDKLFDSVYIAHNNENKKEIVAISIQLNMDAVTKTGGCLGSDFIPAITECIDDNIIWLIKKVFKYAVTKYIGDTTHDMPMKMMVSIFGMPMTGIFSVTFADNIEFAANCSYKDLCEYIEEKSIFIPTYYIYESMDRLLDSFDKEEDD